MHYYHKAVCSLMLLSAVLSAGDFGGGSITGGIALPVGEGSDAWKIGMNFEGTGYGNLNGFVSLGGKFGFNRWTPDDDAFQPGTEVDASLIYLELLPIVRINVPIAPDIKYFIEPGMGLYLGIARVSVSYMGYNIKDSDSEADFGMSFATGFDIYYFELKPQFKIVFTQAESTKWFAITLGLVF
ncbi:MAG: outer membrane beta-barrel protein [Chitinispirillaceae bacterium]|nr:outer membrane beta-barrel protein [Chitinispirillaceae bacterium]